MKWIMLMMIVVIIIVITSCTGGGTKTEPPQGPPHSRFWTAAESSDGIESLMYYLASGRSSSEFMGDVVPKIYILIMDLQATDDQWRKYIDKVKTVVANMRRGESIAMIGIDDNSMEDSNVLLELQSITARSSSPKFIEPSRRKIVEKIDAIAREQYTGTEKDVFGALWQGAHLAANRPKSQPVVLCFSNLTEAGDQTAEMPQKTEAAIMPSDQIGQMLNSPSGSVELYFNFETASYRLTPSVIAQLNELGSALKMAEFNDTAFSVVGHTDNRGSEAYNIWLGSQRASTVVSYLVQAFGISGERLTYSSKGMSEPKVQGDTEEARAQNRRVVISKIGGGSGALSGQSQNLKIEVPTDIRYYNNAEGGFFYVQTSEYKEITAYWQEICRQFGINVSQINSITY